MTDAARPVEWLALDDIVGADANPREHDLPALQRSIARFGFADPPEMDDRTGKLVAGHGRVAALTAMRAGGLPVPAGVRVDDDGRWLAPVIRGWSSRSDAEALAYLVSNNRQTERARWGAGLLSALERIEGSDPGLLEDAGYAGKDMARLRNLQSAPDLDTFAAEVGSGTPEDGWPTVKIRAEATVAAAWKSHLDTHHGDGVRALAALLDVDPEPPAPGVWDPDEWPGNDGDGI